MLGQKVLVGSREAREETHGIVEYEAAKKERERGKWEHRTKRNQMRRAKRKKRLVNKRMEMDSSQYNSKNKKHMEFKCHRVACVWDEIVNNWRRKVYSRRRSRHLRSSRHKSTLAGCDPSGKGPARLLIFLLTRRLLLVLTARCGSGSSSGFGGGGGFFSFSSAAEHCLAPFLYSAALDGSNCAAWEEWKYSRRQWRGAKLASEQK